MLVFWGIIKGFIGSSIAQYAIIGLVGLGAIAWLRADAAAPYKATISKLKKAADDKEKIEGEDRRRAEANASKAEELQNELDRIVADTKAGACKLSADELSRLQYLAGTGKRADSDKPKVPSRTR